jgi:hypothetical protein
MNPAVVTTFLFITSLTQQCKHEKFPSKTITSTSEENASKERQRRSWKSCCGFSSAAYALLKPHVEKEPKI